MTSTVLDSFRVVGDYSGTWEVREVEPRPGELAPHQALLVFTARDGATRKAPAPRGTLRVLGPEELRRLLEKATGT